MLKVFLRAVLLAFLPTAYVAAKPATLMPPVTPAATSVTPASSAAAVQPVLPVKPMSPAVTGPIRMGNVGSSFLFGPGDGFAPLPIRPPLPPVRNLACSCPAQLHFPFSEEDIKAERGPCESVEPVHVSEEGCRPFIDPREPGTWKCRVVMIEEAYRPNCMFDTEPQKLCGVELKPTRKACEATKTTVRTRFRMKASDKNACEAFREDAPFRPPQHAPPLPGDDIDSEQSWRAVHLFVCMNLGGEGIAAETQSKEVACGTTNPAPAFPIGSEPQLVSDNTDCRQCDEDRRLDPTIECGISSCHYGIKCDPHFSGPQLLEYANEVSCELR